jgi:hypothetical protein
MMEGGKVVHDPDESVYNPALVPDCRSSLIY